MADGEKKKKKSGSYVDVRTVTGESEVSFADAVKQAINGLYDEHDKDNTRLQPASCTVTELGGTVTPNPGKINYVATLNVSGSG